MKMVLICIVVLVSSMAALADMFLKYKKTTSSYAVAGQTIP